MNKWITLFTVPALCAVGLTAWAVQDDAKRAEERAKVEREIRELEAQLTEHQVSISVTTAARRWLAENGFDPQMGARPMARIIQEHIKRALADELLFGKLRNGGKVTVDVDKDEKVHLVFSDSEEPAGVA